MTSLTQSGTVLGTRLISRVMVAKQARLRTTMEASLSQMSSLKKMTISPRTTVIGRRSRRVKLHTRTYS